MFLRFFAYTQALLLGRDLHWPFSAFKSYDLKAVQISSMFCISAEDLICTSRCSSGAKPCTPLTCSPLPCCLPPSLSPPQTTRAVVGVDWVCQHHRMYLKNVPSYKESFCVFWHNWSFSPCDCLFLICSNTPCAPLSSVWQLGVVIKYLTTVWVEGTGSLCVNRGIIVTKEIGFL